MRFLSAVYSLRFTRYLSRILERVRRGIDYRHNYVRFRKRTLDYRYSFDDTARMGPSSDSELHVDTRRIRSGRIIQQQREF